MLGHGKSKLVSGARSLTTTFRACNSHYDVLGLTPKASQNEIKTAYYKLSKVYHPDKSPDEASAKKFRAISEAYEVLGNIKLKNMYDKGFIRNRGSVTDMAPEPEPEPTDPSLKFYKSRVTRNVVPTMDGRTPIYDFDAWAKNHYSTLYEKKRYDKEFVEQRQMKLQQASSAHRQEIAMFFIIIMSGLFIVLVVQGTADYDQDTTSKQNNVDTNAVNSVKQ